MRPARQQRLRLTIPIGLLQPISLPAFAVRGAHAGPTAMFVAGVHGDEFEGVAAIHELLGRLDPAHVTGNILALPVCNPFAYEAQARQTPETVDGLNLAREFPGSGPAAPPNGSPPRCSPSPAGCWVPTTCSSTSTAPAHVTGTHRWSASGTSKVQLGPPSEEAARRFGGRLWRIADQPERSMRRRRARACPPSPQRQPVRAAADPTTSPGTSTGYRTSFDTKEW